MVLFAHVVRRETGQHTQHSNIGEGVDASRHERRGHRVADYMDDVTHEVADFATAIHVVDLFEHFYQGFENFIRGDLHVHVFVDGSVSISLVIHQGFHSTDKVVGIYATVVAVAAAGFIVLIGTLAPAVRNDVPEPFLQVDRVVVEAVCVHYTGGSIAILIRRKGSSVLAYISLVWGGKAAHLENAGLKGSGRGG